METGKLVSALVLGLIVGVVVGYFFIAQPQISRLQTDLSKAQSEVESSKEELTEAREHLASALKEWAHADHEIESLKAQVSALTSEVESLREELTREKGVPILLRHVPCEVLVAVLEYIKENHLDVAEYIFLEPLIYDVEIEERIGYTTCIFKIYPPPGSERNWVVTIGYPVVPLEKLTYEVHAEYDGIVWEGTVEHITRIITEISYSP